MARTSYCPKAFNFHYSNDLSLINSAQQCESYRRLPLFLYFVRLTPNGSRLTHRNYSLINIFVCLHTERKGPHSNSMMQFIMIHDNSELNEVRLQTVAILFAPGNFPLYPMCSTERVIILMYTRYN